MNSLQKAYMYMTSVLLITLAVGVIFFMGGPSLTGAFSVVDLAPKNFTFEEPLGVSQESAFFALKVAEGEVVEIQQTSLRSHFVEDVLLDANKSYVAGNYSDVFKATQLISFIKKERVLLEDRFTILENKENGYMEEGINTSSGHAIIDKARTAFTHERYDETYLLLDESLLELERAKIEHNRKRTIAHLSKNFILRYWWQLLLGLAVLSVITPIVGKKIHRSRLKKKLKRLQHELEKSQEMIKRLQKSCFVNKTITTEGYKAKSAKLEERIAEIKHTIPVLEAELKGRKKPRREKKKPKGVLEVKR